MRRLSLLPLLLLPAALAAAAQTPGAPPTDACATPAEAYLDAGNVRARLLQNGGFFHSGSPHVYEVPKGGGVQASFSASLWIGGRVRDSLRITAETYGRRLFRPGPLGADGRPPTDCAPFNRLYELTRDDLERLAAGEVTPNVRDWPAPLGAPTTADGTPVLYGDQTLWWVMNDVAAPRVDPPTQQDPPAQTPWRYDAPPVGVDVRVAAFALDAPGTLGDATFYRFAITYHGDAPLDSAYVGLFVDDDLGYPWDDFVGSDTTLSLAYTYGADDDDEGGYGPAPPALGYTLLRTPAGDDGAPLGMTAFVPLWKGGGPYGEPSVPEQFYHNLTGRWRHGQPMYVGGDGTPDDPAADPARPTRFGFPGDPAARAFWSMMNVDGAGTAHWTSDKRFAFSSGPFTMQPGETEEVWLAVAWSRGADHLDSVRELREDVAYLHAIADRLFAPASVSTSDEPAPAAPAATFAPPYPNPATDQTHVRYRLSRAANVRLALYDALGREVRLLAAGARAEGSHSVEVDVRGLAPGAYFLRLTHSGRAFTRALIVAR